MKEEPLEPPGQVEREQPFELEGRVKVELLGRVEEEPGLRMLAPPDHGRSRPGRGRPRGTGTHRRLLAQVAPGGQEGEQGRVGAMSEPESLPNAAAGPVVPRRPAQPEDDVIRRILGGQGAHRTYATH